MPIVDDTYFPKPLDIAEPDGEWKFTNISPFNDPQASPHPDVVLCSEDYGGFYANSNLLETAYFEFHKVFAQIRTTSPSGLRIENDKIVIYVADTAEDIAATLRAAYSLIMPIPKDPSLDAFLAKIQALGQYTPTDVLALHLLADFTNLAEADPLDAYTKAYSKRLPSQFIQVAAALCLAADDPTTSVRGQPRLAGGSAVDQCRRERALVILSKYNRACNTAVLGLVGRLVGRRHVVIGLSFLEDWQMPNTPWTDCLHGDQSEITIGKGEHLIRIKVSRRSVLFWEELFWNLYRGAPTASTVDTFMERLPSLLEVVGGICPECATSVPTHMKTLCDRLKDQIAKVQQEEFEKVMSFDSGRV